MARWGVGVGKSGIGGRALQTHGGSLLKYQSKPQVSQNEITSYNLTIDFELMLLNLKSKTNTKMCFIDESFLHFLQ